MVKTISLIRRKAGISRKEFARHYEDVHAPLAVKLLKAIKGYVRNHIVDTPGTQETDFDCISEFWFDSIEDSVKVVEFWQSEDGQVIRDDEQKFMDTSKTVSFLVDERVSDINASVDVAVTDMVKAIALLKRKQGLSAEDFIRHYEEVHAPLIVKNSTGLKRYVRNHVVPLGDIENEPKFDCITELWYEDLEAYKASISTWGTEAGRVIRDDEDSFLDRSKIAFFLVNYRISK
jgi:uncharacterized protein (TIGR02118 family)